MRRRWLPGLLAVAVFLAICVFPVSAILHELSVVPELPYQVHDPSGNDPDHCGHVYAHFTAASAAEAAQPRVRPEPRPTALATTRHPDISRPPPTPPPIAAAA